MKVKFDELFHKYTLVDDDDNEIKDLISVTQLLEKHNISPDYSMVDEDVLAKKAERGTIVHGELENYIKHGIAGFTGELEAFMNKCKEENIKPLNSEFIVFDDDIAGTVDVAGVIGKNELPFIGDFKTTATVHQKAVAWQLSLYAYLYADEIFERYLCFHFPNEFTCKMIEITPIAVEEIERLLECERTGQVYKERTLELSAVETEKILAVQNELKLLDEKKKELESQEKELKETLIKKMEETGIKSIDNDLFKITYVAPFQRETVDSAKLKKERPELALEYMKTSLVKATVKITLKQDKLTEEQNGFYFERATRHS